MHYIPKLDHSPTAQALTLALGVRAGDVPGQPSESLRCLASMSLLDMAKEAAFWRIGRLNEEIGTSELIRAEFDFSGGMMAGAFDDFFQTTVLNTYAESDDKSDDLLMETEIPNYQPGRVIIAVDNFHLTLRGKGHADVQSLRTYTYSWRACEFARSVIVNEMDLIDDCFDVIKTCAKALGRAPRRAKQDLLFSLILENPTLPTDNEQLFSSAHNNLLTGPSSALSSTSLASAIQKIREQIFIDDDGYIIHPELAPKYLCVPPALEDTARQILRLAKLDDPKIDIQLRVTSRLGPAGVCNPITGEIRQGISTNWCLFTSAADSPVFAIGFLPGMKKPIIRTSQLAGPGAPGQWGIAYDLHQSFAMTACDYRGACWSNGA